MSHVLPNISRGQFFEPIFTSKKFDLYTSIYGKSIIPQLVLQSYRQDNYNKIALTYIKSHLYTCTDQINKGNFFSICRKKDLEKYQFTVCLKFKFKNRNIYWLKFEKIGTSRFLEVLKVKNWDCPDKIGTVGRYASTMVYEFSVTLIDCSTN